MQWTMTLPDEPVIAPDGSEVRPLLATTGASLAHCVLPPGAVSRAVRHKTVEEIWYFIAGAGEVWRKSETREEVVEARASTCLTIPTGAHFQFRTLGDAPLVFLLATLPPWPGMDEAVRVRTTGRRLTVRPRRRLRGLSGRLTVSAQQIA